MPAPRPRHLLRAAAALAAIASSVPALAEEMPAPQPVSLGQSIGMAFFLLLAALIVVSILCKLFIATGLVTDRTTWPGRVVFALAGVVGTVRTTRGSTGATRSSAKGGGGSFGGGGAAGGW